MNIKNLKSETQKLNTPFGFECVKIWAKAVATTAAPANIDPIKFNWTSENVAIPTPSKIMTREPWIARDTESWYLQT